MVELNLLPWREKLYQYQIKELKKILLLSVLLACLSIYLPHFLLNHRLNFHEMQLASLEAQFEQHVFLEKSLNLGAEKQEVAAYYQFDMANFFQMLSETDKKVCFSSITRKKNEWLFQGESRGALALNHFLLSWSGSELFPEIKIEELKEKGNEAFMHFLLSARN